jgi:16S rRNA (uracil1498-N3)-methyltransferase
VSASALRLYVALPADHVWPADEAWPLPPAAVRHLQVRRLQPGDRFHLFDGRGGEWQATLTEMGRREAFARVGEPVPPLPEPPLAVTLALGVPANERMDAVVEKAVELGAAALQPLWTARAVLRLSGERAQRRRDHWQALAASACEQCGRAFLPPIAPPAALADWLGGLGPARAGEQRWLLHPGADLPSGLPPDLRAAPPAWPGTGTGTRPVLTVLSGPEGGLAPAELDAARMAGFVPVGLGPRILRADTAPLAVLAWALLEAGRQGLR